MRLRSSQFVFLMLLVCSVQIRQEYALQLMADAISGRTSTASQQRETPSKAVEASSHSALPQGNPQEALRLAPAARSAHRVIWTMRRPASDSTAVVSFTGLLRAGLLRA